MNSSNKIEPIFVISVSKFILNFFLNEKYKSGLKIVQKKRYLCIFDESSLHSNF